MPGFKVLNVAEKNDAAKNIANIMSGGRANRREGFSQFNKIYEFDYIVQGQQAEMVMTSLSGHLLNMEFAPQYRKWYSCNPVALFDAPLAKGVGEGNNSALIKKTLQREVRGAKLLIIWTDCDREGENIGMEVVTVCREVLPGVRILRAKFSEITRPSIERAMATLGQLDERVSDAVDVRQELDLRIGAAFTRLQTLRLPKLFPASLGDKLISYGSCQFPTMGFVVERFKSIQGFHSEPFWKIKVTHEERGCKVEFQWKRVRLFEEVAVQILAEKCQDSPTARVLECRSKPKNKWRPLPLDTVELEKQGSRKLRLTAKETMAAAEKLYTAGLISYPRTETNIFPKELQLAPLVEAQQHDNRWGEFAGQVLANGGPRPRVGKKSDQAHPPIHPLKAAGNLQGNEAKVYEFVTRHFLACVSADALGKETTVRIDIAEEEFVGQGLTVIQRNYLEVYIYERWSDKEILDYEGIQEFEPTSIDVVEGHTEPPKLLTEADLIALMDKHGIGTDATHAEHIETVKSREYVFVEGGDKLVPGKLAMALVDGYDAMGDWKMSKPDLRAGLEADLKLVCDGRKTKEEVLHAQVERYKQVFQGTVDAVIRLDAATAHYFGENPVQGMGDNGGGGGGGDGFPEPVVDCSICGLQLCLKKTSRGSWMVGCQGNQACAAAPLWLPDSVKEASVGETTCNTCNLKPRNVRLVLSRGALAPQYPDRFSACLGGCDVFLLQALGVSRLNSGALVRPRQDDRGRGARGGVHRGGGSRGGGDGRGGPRGGGGGGRGEPRGGGGGGRGDPRGGGAMAVGRAARRPRAGRGGRGGEGRGRGVGRGGNFGEADYDNGFNTQAQGTSQAFQAKRQQLQELNGGVAPVPIQGVVNCKCNQPAVSRTVRKEGPNKGRDFFCCSKPQGEQCGYFKFSDELEQGGGSQGGGGGGGFGSAVGFGGGGGSDPEAPVCQCGQVKLMRTVRKEGPTQNKQFFCCPKDREQQCQGAFQWVEDVAQGGHGGGGGGYGGGRGQNFGGGRGAFGQTRGRGRGEKRMREAIGGEPGEKKQRKCGLCHQPGHTRNKCPQKEDHPGDGWS